MTNITPIAFAGANAGRISARRHLGKSNSNSYNAVSLKVYIITRLAFLAIFLLFLFSMQFLDKADEQTAKVDEWIGFHTIIQVEDSNLNTHNFSEYEYRIN